MALARQLTINSACPPDYVIARRMRAPLWWHGGIRISSPLAIRIDVVDLGKMRG